jgi:hypothetical protein
MRKPAKATNMVDIVGQAIAAADGGRFAADRARYRRLAVAVIIDVSQAPERGISVATAVRSDPATRAAGLY